MMDNLFDTGGVYQIKLVEPYIRNMRRNGIRKKRFMSARKNAMRKNWQLTRMQTSGFGLIPVAQPFSIKS